MEEEQQKQRKPSNTSAMIAVLIVLAIGAYVVWGAVNSKSEANQQDEAETTQVDDQSDETPVADEKGTTALLQTAGKQGEEGEMNLWKEASGALTVSIPHAWEVHQNVAGNVRFIESFDPANTQDVLTVWIQQRDIGTEEDLSLAQWMELSVQGLSEIKECERRSIGGLEMACLEGKNQKMPWIMYFSELNEKELVGVFKTHTSLESSTLIDVTNSINLAPSQAELDEAITIP